MAEEEKKDPSQIVSGQNVLPCGCVEREYADGRKEVMPCPPHGLMEAGRHLAMAGNMLASIGQRMLHEQQAQAMAAVNDAVQKAANRT